MTDCKIKPPPPTLSYRSPGTARGVTPLGLDYGDVAVGFLSTFVLIPLAAAVVLAGASGDVLSLAVAVAATTIIGVGFGRGVYNRRWEFLIGAGLFAAGAVAVGGLAWVLRR